MSERKRLVAAISDLLSIIENMHADFQNDVSQGRAEKMNSHADKAKLIARPILDRYPPEYGK